MGLGGYIVAYPLKLILIRRRRRSLYRCTGSSGLRTVEKSRNNSHWRTLELDLFRTTQPRDCFALPFNNVNVPSLTGFASYDTRSLPSGLLLAADASAGYVDLTYSSPTTPAFGGSLLRPPI
jgi:hypothetical protein